LFVTAEKQRLSVASFSLSSSMTMLKFDGFYAQVTFRCLRKKQLFLLALLLRFPFGLVANIS